MNAAFAAGCWLVSCRDGGMLASVDETSAPTPPTGSFARFRPRLPGVGMNYGLVKSVKDLGTGLTMGAVAFSLCIGLVALLAVELGLANLRLGTMLVGVILMATAVLKPAKHP